MRTTRAVFALPLAFAAFGACSSSDTGVHVGVAPSIVFPEGLLDSVSKLTLQVYDAGGVDCDGTTGLLKGSGTPIATKDLASTGCPANAKFCGDVQVDTSDTPRVFLAKAFETGNTNAVASGCTKATVNQSTLQVTIKMLRAAPPALCGGQPSKLPAVQCDTPGDASDTVCDPTCQTKEVFLAAGDATTTSSSKPKTRPSFVWRAGTGANGYFAAFFGDKSPVTRTQVSMRLMADDLHTTSDFGLGVQSASYFLPNNPTGTPFPPVGEAGSQNNPAAVFAGGKYFVAFENNAAGPNAINLRTLDTPIKSTQGPGAPLKVSDPGAAMSLPAIALSGGKVLIAWQSNGSILARTVDTGTLALGTQQTLGSGQNVSVAGMPTGWVLAYESGADVKMQLVDATGAGKGEQKVNDATHSGQQQHPGIAALSDGRFAVAWIDSGAQGGAGVFAQRYDATAKPVAGDQALRINTNTGDQSNTAIGAGGSGPKAFFAVAWVDNASGHVRARLLDGSSGFQFNSVTAQNDDFQVSQADGRMRSNPVVTTGGAGPFLAIGWQDDTTGLVDPQFPGIWARRFPLP